MDGGVSRVRETAVVLSFRDRFVRSSQFVELFREGMALVDETAIYLDRQGRTDSKALPQAAAALFAPESMRLTARLMQVASWLLTQRAVANGDITALQAQTHRGTVGLTAQSRCEAASFGELPETFRRLIADSHRIHMRILHLDKLMKQAIHQDNGLMERTEVVRLASTA
jgi:regulator of CtrA degradation